MPTAPARPDWAARSNQFDLFGLHDHAPSGQRHICGGCGTNGTAHTARERHWLRPTTSRSMWFSGHRGRCEPRRTGDRRARHGVCDEQRQRRSDLITDVGIASSYLSSASPIIAARLTSPSATPSPSRRESSFRIPTPPMPSPFIHSTERLYSSPQAYGGSQAPQSSIWRSRGGTVSIQGRSLTATFLTTTPASSPGLYADRPHDYGPAPSLR